MWSYIKVYKITEDIKQSESQTDNNQKGIKNNENRF